MLINILNLLFAMDLTQPVELQRAPLSPMKTPKKIKIKKEYEPGNGKCLRNNGLFPANTSKSNITKIIDKAKRKHQNALSAQIQNKINYILQANAEDFGVCIFKTNMLHTMLNGEMNQRTINILMADLEHLPQEQRTLIRSTFSSNTAYSRENNSAINLTMILTSPNGKTSQLFPEKPISLLCAEDEEMSSEEETYKENATINIHPIEMNVGSILSQLFNDGGTY